MAGRSSTMPGCPVLIWPTNKGKDNVKMFILYIRAGANDINGVVKPLAECTKLWNYCKSLGGEMVRQMSCVVFLLMSAFLPQQVSADNTNDTSESFAIKPGIEKMILGSTVVVKGYSSVGSGFICKMDGAKWLVTNEHVARSIQAITARYVEDGKIVPFELSKTKDNEKAVFIEVASDRDLVRIKVKDIVGQGEGLVVSDDIVIGKPVRAYGNSDGAGVVTALSGRILGIGPNSLEVDIPFVQGNSGGAIVDGNGHVVGVVTYATINNEPENWMKTGTRFNKVRRFGVRLGGIKWVKMKLSDYTDRCRKLHEFDVCEEFLFSICLKPVDSVDKWIKFYSYNPAASKWSVINKVRKNLEWMRESALRNAIIDIYSKVFEAEPKIARYRNGTYICVPWGYESKLQNTIQLKIGIVKRNLQRYKGEYWLIDSLKSERAEMIEFIELLEIYMKDSSNDGFKRHFTHNYYESPPQYHTLRGN